MKREILFRGKRKDNGEWTYGVPFVNDEGDCIMTTGSYRHSVIEETVGQYTGLRDKRGKMIYESDVIEADNGNRGYVVFEHGAFMKLCNPEDMPLTIAEDVNVVIGNVHDNIGLLKGE